MRPREDSTPNADTVREVMSTLSPRAVNILRLERRRVPRDLIARRLGLADAAAVGVEIDRIAAEVRDKLGRRSGEPRAPGSVGSGLRSGRFR